MWSMGPTCICSYLYIVQSATHRVSIAGALSRRVGSQYTGGFSVHRGGLSMRVVLEQYTKKDARWCYGRPRVYILLAFMPWLFLRRQAGRPALCSQQPVPF